MTGKSGFTLGYSLGIKYKLLISYILVIIVPVLIGTWLPYVYTDRIMVRETDEALRFSVDKIVESIKYRMKKYNSISNKLSINNSLSNSLLRYISADYTGKEGEAYNAAREILTKFNDEINNSDSEIVNIRLYKNNDTMPNYADYILDEMDFRDMDWHREVYNNKGVAYWKDGTYKPFNLPQIKTVSLINRIFSSSEAGLLEIELRQSRIFSEINNFDYKNGSLIALLNQDGSVITHNSKNGQGFEDIFPYIRTSFVQGAGESFTQKILKEEYIIINKELNFQGWRVIAAVPLKELYSSTYTIRLVTLATALSCIIVFLIITVFISGLMTSRIKKLTKKMRRVEDGDFNVEMTVKGNDEISQLSRGFNSMVRSIRNLIEEVYKSKLEKKEAELRALQEQINPHFLYNSLSSINWLAVQAGAPRIIDTVEALAAFYRLSLNKGREIISLKDELAQAKAYVALQKLRYEDSFEVNFEVEPDVEDAEIIKFILQPFLENAIIHGFGDENKGTVYVTAKGIGQEILIIRIIDDGKGMDESKLKSFSAKGGGAAGNGYGIRNVDERIKIHYGANYGVEITSRQGTGTVVEIRLPFITVQSKENAAGQDGSRPRA